MADHPYVSRELSHFVGRSLRHPDDTHDHDAQFALLLTVLRSGKVLARETSSSITFRTPLYPEDLGRYEMAPICFCDIPEPALRIHVEKYSSFGLAFSKEFLIAHGVRPVFYVSETTVWGTDNYLVRDRMNDLVKSLGCVEGAMHAPGALIDKGHPLHKHLTDVLSFLVEEELLKFVKWFDPSLPDNHPEN